MIRFARSWGTVILLAAVMSLLAPAAGGASRVPIGGTPSAPASAGNLVLRVRYAPWPLRYLFELRRGMPALIDFGVTVSNPIFARRP